MGLHKYTKFCIYNAKKVLTTNFGKQNFKFFWTTTFWRVHCYPVSLLTMLNDTPAYPSPENISKFIYTRPQNQRNLGIPGNITLQPSPLLEFLLIPVFNSTFVYQCLHLSLVETQSKVIFSGKLRLNFINKTKWHLHKYSYQF